MAGAYLGEIRIFAGNYAPAGWADCNGATMPIVENDALFNLIGTTYGGDGQSTFNVPNLSGRVPIHMGKSPAGATTYPIGQSAGVETVTLTTNETPIHNHAFLASTAGGESATPEGHIVAANNSPKIYLQAAPDGQIAASSLAPVGGGQPHDNMMPTVVIRYIICIAGIYPTQS